MTRSNHQPTVLTGTSAGDYIRTEASRAVMPNPVQDRLCKRTLPPPNALVPSCGLDEPADPLIPVSDDVPVREQQAMTRGSVPEFVRLIPSSTGLLTHEMAGQVRFSQQNRKAHHGF